MSMARYAYGFQSWYWGYILSVALVLAAAAILPERRRGAAGPGGTARHTLFYAGLPVLALLLLTLLAGIARACCLSYLAFFRKAYGITFDSGFDPAGNALVYASGSVEQYVEGYKRYLLAEKLQASSLLYWLKNCWKYLLFALALSPLAVCLRCRVKKRSFCLVGTGVVFLLLCFCLLDRSLSLSARLLFLPADDAAHIETDYNRSINDGEPFWLLSWGGVETTYEWDITFDVGRDIPVYDTLGSGRPAGDTVPAGSRIRVRDLNCVNTAERLDRLFLAEIRRPAALVSPDTTGPLFIRGYVEKSALLRAIGPFSRNGLWGFLARRYVYSADCALFEKGVVVTRNVMRAFMPLEILLLLPLLLAFAWVAFRPFEKKNKKTAAPAREQAL